jgi:hypothetical protein
MISRTGLIMPNTIRFGRDSVMKLRQLLAAQHPFAYCDGCLAFQIYVSLAEARAAAMTVSGEPGFSRQRRECHGCRRMVEQTVMTRGQ